MFIQQLITPKDYTIKIKFNNKDKIYNRKDLKITGEV